MSELINPQTALAILLVWLAYWFLIKSASVRQDFLTVVFIAILSYLQPFFTLFILLATLIAYSTLLKPAADAKRQTVFISTVFCILLLVLWKYNCINFLLKGFLKNQSLLSSIGVSYFSFRLLQVIYDVNRKMLKCPSLWSLIRFLFFAPIFAAGPIERFQSFAEQVPRSYNNILVVGGFYRIIVGLFKKIVVVEFIINHNLGQFISSGIQGELSIDASASDPLFFTIVMYIRAFLDLSAYTDIAIGLSNIFGYKIMENFNFPFLAHNLSDFWKRWHISLSSWCQNQVFFPVFGLTRKPWIGIFATMLVMGMWHHLNWNWTAWAVYHSIGLIVVLRWDKFKRKKRALKKFLSHKVFLYGGILITNLYVSLGYAFVSCVDLPKAVHIYKQSILGILRMLCI